MAAYVRAAYVSNTRNVHGSVVCMQAGALPFLLQAGQTVHFVPPTLRGPRSAQVKSVAPVREGSWEVAFEGIESIDDAELLCGSYCLVARDGLHETLAIDLPALLEGFTVEDAQFGVLGVVDEVLESPAQATLSVAGPDGQVLIPYVDAFIENVDEDARTIATCIPEGLLSLNNSAGEEGSTS